MLFLVKHALPALGLSAMGVYVLLGQSAAAQPALTQRAMAPPAMPQTAMGKPAPSVEVFTTSELPFTDVPMGQPLPGYPLKKNSDAELNIAIYYLDGIQQLEAHLSQGLPASAAQAQQQVMTRLQSLEPEQLEWVKTSATGLGRALQYGVDRCPAVVFDGRVVVYGVRDFASARALHARWHRGQAGQAGQIGQAQ